MRDLVGMRSLSIREKSGRSISSWSSSVLFKSFVVGLVIVPEGVEERRILTDLMRTLMFAFELFLPHPILMKSFTIS
jgi:hypothetical protein